MGIERAQPHRCCGLGYMELEHLRHSARGRQPHPARMGTRGRARASPSSRPPSLRGYEPRIRWDGDAAIAQVTVSCDAASPSSPTPPCYHTCITLTAHTTLAAIRPSPLPSPPSPPMAPSPSPPPGVIATAGLSIIQTSGYCASYLTTPGECERAAVALGLDLGAGIQPRWTSLGHAEWVLGATPPFCHYKPSDLEYKLHFSNPANTGVCNMLRQMHMP